MSNSVRPHRRQPTRLPHPWDSPGKNTGVGCNFLLQCMKAKSESEVAQSCPTLCDPMDCSPPGSSVHGIFEARVLEYWSGVPFPSPDTGQRSLKRRFGPQDRTLVDNPERKDSTSITELQTKAAHRKDPEATEAQLSALQESRLR